MDQINALLDKASEMCGAKNDSDLAKRLGVRHTAVSNWRHGRAKPDVVTAEKLAKMTNGNLARIVAMIEESRAQSAAAKAVWRKIASAAAILIAVYTYKHLGGDHADLAMMIPFLHSGTVVGIANRSRTASMARNLRKWFTAVTGAVRGPLWTIHGGKLNGPGGMTVSAWILTAALWRASRLADRMRKRA